MSESVLVPRKATGGVSALGWLGAIGLLFVVALALPIVLLREQIVLFATIRYEGAESYLAAPLVPFPAPPAAAGVETIELDGLRFSVPADSIDRITIGEELEGRLTIYLKNGLLVALDPPIRPTPRSGEVDARVDGYVASPDDFSWGASAEETRRLGRALALKESCMFLDMATGVSQTNGQGWEAYAIRCPGIHTMKWDSTDKTRTGIVWVHRPKTVDADDEELADLVFGSFEMTALPRGSFDAEARRLVEEFGARTKGE